MNKLGQLERRIKVLEKIVLGNDIPIKPVQDIVKKSLKAISIVTNQKISDIVSRCRKRSLVEARCIVMYYLKHNTRMSLTDIGAIFGGKDHSTTLHSLQTHNNLMFLDKTYKENWDKFNELINELPKTSK